ncbi:hypothetical protein Agabi119p4_7528 [Agaricus bisporus var. burnettii]|uniref:Association with the SNF1 complex (ASC) domain-containing protein n=1 Tax=Agaricus bisporus var. burnettii TaxID=192524 RepID=A0A8H7C8E3_AGABI|nr:hypothetical protein Agabi119p4_7528 [Agaricus bisporus var. burnettii]
MGNSASSTAPPRTGRPTEPRPRSPGEKEASVGPRRRSLELPDFNRSFSRGRPRTPPKTEAINIPRAAPDAPPVQRPHNNFSSTDLIIPATHLPFPPNQRILSTSSHGAARAHRSRGGPQPMQSIYPDPASDQHLHRRHQQLALTPSSPTPFVKEIVHSTIPIGLCVDPDSRGNDDDEEENGLAQPAPVDDPALADFIPVKFTWRGGGKVVILARAGDDDWNGRQPMEREHPNSNTWVATVYLLPGTHHVRFLVDDQWRVSDEMSTAVDDQGSLANYVNVQPGGTPPSQSSPLPPPAQQPPPSRQQHHVPGQSFWSVGSSVDDDYRPQQDLVTQVIQARWTSELPPELIEAAREEEAYLTASAGQYDAAARSVHVSGFVPAPSVPPAPGMPRHLDKLIMNTRMTIPSQHSSGNSNTGSPARQSTHLPGGIGSGQGGSNGRERDRSGRREPRQHRRREGRENREKEQQRERDRRGIEDRQKREREKESVRRDSGYPNLPPAPPPSEDGSGVGLDEKPEHSPVREGGGEEESSTNNTTPEVCPTPEPTQTPKIPTQTLSTPIPTSTSTSIPTRPGPSPLTNELRGPVSGSRAITLDMENMPALTDDASVLPVPSHVVLQHLCTSAIKNGVVAVATTTRYRKKFMTTVYYKPT